ncbi:hypothetical protein JCM6882_002455 [Rhodosporidiobolus microsporus]
MLSSRFSLAAFVALLAGSQAAFAQEGTSGPSVTSPTLYQCMTASFGYTCDSPPCTIVIRPSDDATQSIATLDEISDIQGTRPWPVDQAEGTSVTAWITNSQGQTKSNAATTINGGDSTCLGSSGSSASSGSSGSSATTGGSAASTGASATSDADSSSETGSSDNEDNGAAGLAVGGLIASTFALAAYLA